MKKLLGKSGETDGLGEKKEIDIFASDLSKLKQHVTLSKKKTELQSKENQIDIFNSRGSLRKSDKTVSVVPPR